MQVMAQSTTVLAQILKQVPKKLFDKLADEYHVNKHASILKAFNHFALLIFAQLTKLESTRDIQHATTALFSGQRADGLIPVKKSTLADANKRINWCFYRDLFYGLLTLFSSNFPRHKFPVPGDLLSLDSSMITLCLSVFKWAKYRTLKGALKLHALLDHNGYILRDMVITNGKVHDITVARKMRFAPGTTLLIDRGYFDSAWLYGLQQQGVYFVTLMKSTIGFEWIKRRSVKGQKGVRFDWIGYMTDSSGNKYPTALRLIRYVDPETGKLLEFLTNLLELNAITIAELYKERWQIELFFKWIKQNLKIKTFLGTSENAVMSQIWVAMIAFLLLRVLQLSSESKITTHQLLVFISTHALVNIAISKAWQAFQRTSDDAIIKKRKRTRKLLR